MESSEGLALGTLITLLTAALGYLLKLNHHRIRSTCCNRACVSSIDVDKTSPAGDDHEKSTNN
jgi:hypothetical protein